ncbi:hypothetical protein ACFSHQ_00940 [Gemmobacter lanyuensis]
MLLVLDVSGQAQSAAATAVGFAAMRPGSGLRGGAEPRGLAPA